MARTYDNYADLITFTRASSGTALRPISYGDELVTNGTFDTDTSGWEGFLSGTASSTLSVVSNTLRVTKTGTIAGFCEYEITGLTIGKIYSASVDVISSESALFAGSLSSQNTSPTFGESSYSVNATTRKFNFVATSDTFYVILATLAAYCDFDNVSVREVLFDQPNGTLTLFNHPTNIPRIEYDANGNRLGLLVEESRTNLVTYSEDFSNVYWTKQSSVDSVEDGNILGPNGLVSGTKVTTNDVAYVSKDSIYFTQNITVTFSAFLKAGSITTVGLHYAQDLGDALNDNCDFDLSNGTVSSQGSASTAKIEYVGNGWYRCSNTYTTNGTGTVLGVRFVVQGAGTFYVYGAQLEAGSFPTSYIPSNSGSTTTRSADVASIGVSEFGYNQSEGTVFVEAEITNQVNLVQRYVIGSNQSSARWLYKNDSQNYITSFDGTASLTVQQETLSDSVPFKAALSTDQTERSIAVNGVVNSGSTNGNIPSLTNQINIGCDHSNTKQLFGHIKSIKYFPRKLTDAQLQELTS